MPRIHTLLCTSLLVASFSSSGQTPAYRDATSPEGALGMLKVTIVSEATMRNRCTAMFPQKSEAIDAELAKWKRAEAKNISKMEARLPALMLMEPRFAGVLVSSAKAVDQQVDGWLKGGGEAGPAKFASFCDNHFAQLASGIWRRRTPKAYEYLDSIP